MRSARPERLPVVYVDGHNYYVDVVRLEFRKVGEVWGDGTHLDFNSPAGTRMWAELLIAECPRCGVTIVAPRYGVDVQCDVCGGAVLDWES